MILTLSHRRQIALCLIFFFVLLQKKKTCIAQHFIYLDMFKPTPISKYRFLAIGDAFREAKSGRTTNVVLYIFLYAKYPHSATIVIRVNYNKLMHVRKVRLTVKLTLAFFHVRVGLKFYLQNLRQREELDKESRRDFYKHCYGLVPY
ncbi:hypothetical protein ACJX0J_029648, partial [Zea mays]